MTAPAQYVSVPTTGTTTTLTGIGNVVCVKSLDGAGIVAVSLGSVTADATGATENNYFVAAAPGDMVVLPCPGAAMLAGTITINLDSTATTKVAAWLDTVPA